MTVTPNEDELLQAVTTAVETIRQATEDRDQAMIAAREAGCTWRSIALAAGMTEKGVIDATKRAEQAEQEAAS